MNKDIRILVAEDSAGTRVLVKKILRNLGFSDVDMVEDGVEALELMQDEDFDLVISDWIMPNMNGLELVAAIRADKRWEQLPILLVTADEEPENIMLAIRAGATNYMSKPYDSKVLGEKIQDIFKFKAKVAQRSKD